jgi:hypothetical protein
VAGHHGEPMHSGVQRLGPEAGESVALYLRRAGASLPTGISGPVWALVELDGYLTPEPAAELVRGVRLSRVILRVALPRVQTALIIRDLPGQRPVTELAEAERSAAQDRLTDPPLSPPPKQRSCAVAALVCWRCWCTATGTRCGRWQGVLASERCMRRCRTRRFRTSRSPRCCPSRLTRLDRCPMTGQCHPDRWTLRAGYATQSTWAHPRLLRFHAAG